MARLAIIRQTMLVMEHPRNADDLVAQVQDTAIMVWRRGLGANRAPRAAQRTTAFHYRSLPIAKYIF